MTQVGVSSILSNIDWRIIVAGIGALGFVAAAIIFFPGTSMAVAVVVVAGGLGASLWSNAEAKGRRGPVTGGGQADVMQIPEIVVTARRPR